MVFGKVPEARMKAADRLHRPVASIAVGVGLEPGVDGIAHEGRHRTPGALRPQTHGSSHVIGELDLHSYHVHTIADPSIVMSWAQNPGATAAPLRGADSCTRRRPIPDAYDARGR